MVAAYEVLIVTPPVANLIRKNKIIQIHTAIMTSKNIGMVLMDNSLETLANNGTISKVEAYERATNPAIMMQTMSHPNYA